MSWSNRFGKRIDGNPTSRHSFISDGIGKHCGSESTCSCDSDLRRPDVGRVDNERFGGGIRTPAAGNDAELDKFRSSPVRLVTSALADDTDNSDETEDGNVESDDRRTPIRRTLRMVVTMNNRNADIVAGQSVRGSL